MINIICSFLFDPLKKKTSMIQVLSNVTDLDDLLHLV